MFQNKETAVICLVFTLSLILLAAVYAEEAPAGPAWSIKGDTVSSCSCSVPCPCDFGSPPTHEECKAVMVFQIQEGAYGEISLKGLSFGMTLELVPQEEAPGFQTTYVGYYIDQAASSEQQEALKSVLSSMPFAMLGKPLGMKETAIKVAEPEEFGQPYTATIGDVAKLEVAPIPGLNPKEPIRVTNLLNPFCSEHMVAKTMSGSFKDYGKNFTFRGTAGAVGKYVLSGGKSEK